MLQRSFPLVPLVVLEEAKQGAVILSWETEWLYCWEEEHSLWVVDSRMTWLVVKHPVVRGGKSLRSLSVRSPES
jgi:hypothetical protein